MERFTEEELVIAKSVDLTAVATSLGYTVRRIGRYHTLKEMDSIRIYGRTNWFRWSRQYDKGENGGSQIDFLRVFQGMDVKEAVFWLLDFAGHRYNREIQNFVNPSPVIKKEKKPFQLPEKSKQNRQLYSYLMGERGLSKAVIDYFLVKGLIYESLPYHNIVFLGKDKEGIARFASMRGTIDKGGKAFKCDVSGNDKRYGFNDVNEENKAVFVFEAAIDLMSYVDLFEDYESNKIGLGMLADAPLETFLEEHPQISNIHFCLDNDEPGRKATRKLLEKYYEKGYEVDEILPRDKWKDFNEELVATRKLTISLLENGRVSR